VFQPAALQFSHAERKGMHGAFGPVSYEAEYAAVPRITASAPTAQRAVRQC
jgi:hypothetical protein